MRLRIGISSPDVFLCGKDKWARREKGDQSFVRHFVITVFSITKTMKLRVAIKEHLLLLLRNYSEMILFIRFYTILTRKTRKSLRIGWV